MSEGANSDRAPLGATMATGRRRRSATTAAGPRDVLDALPLSVIAVDSGGRIVGWNRGAEVILGYAADEMVGTRATSDVLGADPAQVLAEAGQKMGFTRRWEARRADGSVVPLSGGVCSLLDAAGKPVGLVAFAEDMTGRDPGETGLTEERFRTFMAHGPMVAFIKDRQGRHLYMNELMQQVDADQIEDGWYGRTDFDFWPEDVAAKICADDALVLAGDEPREFVETVPMKDGPHTWLTYKFPLPDAKAGRLLGGMAIDITERVRAERERARLAAAVEQTSDAVTVADAAANVVYVNPAFEQLTGYSRAELLGRPSPILRGRSAEGIRAMRRSLRASQSWSGPLALGRSDGATVATETAVSPVRGSDGELVGYVAVSRDMTPVRALEEQLRQGQKMEAIGQLAGGIAHDFNNLLVAIGGYVHALLHSLPPGDPRRTDAEQIRIAAERAASLTNQLLAFSRRQILQPQDVDLNDVIRGILSMLRRLIGENVVLETRLTDEVVPVFADPGQLGQVIVNLATNARDAMPEGGCLSIETFDVEVGRVEAESRGVHAGRYVRLVVRDTGLGIDPAIRSRIFEPFFTTKPSGKGTGLGLATVYGIVEQSAGMIRVESPPGGGSTFVIDFPRSVGVTQRRATTSRHRRPPSSRTILLAEDDAAVRAVAAAALNGAGYRVLEAADGPSALEIAARHRDGIDLLVSDVVMPGVSGDQLLNRLRRARPGLKALLVSGYVDAGYASHLLRDARARRVQFLAKPFGPDDLLERVAEVLKDS